MEAGGDTFRAKLGLLAGAPRAALGPLPRDDESGRHPHPLPRQLRPRRRAARAALLAPPRRQVRRPVERLPRRAGHRAAPARLLGSRWWRGPVTVYGRWPDQPRARDPVLHLRAHARSARARLRVRGAPHLHAAPARALRRATLRREERGRAPARHRPRPHGVHGGGRRQGARQPRSARPRARDRRPRHVHRRPRFRPRARRVRARAHPRAGIRNRGLAQGGGRSHGVRAGPRGHRTAA